MLKRILVPLDGSDLAETVLPYVERLANSTGASVRLFTIATKETDQSQVGAYLKSKQEQMGNVAVETMVPPRKDEAAGAILAEAERWDADLIAMTTHGRSGITRWVFGSVANKVIHASPRPFLLVRARPAAERPADIRIQRILVPLDGSELSLSVLPYVEDIARAVGASLVLFTAVVPLQPYGGADPTAFPISRIDDLIQHAQSSLEKVGKEIESRGLSVHSIAAFGFPADEIIRSAEATKADLIAMATHGRSGLNRWVMGSIADAVLRRSMLPCLMIRPAAVPKKPDRQGP